MIDKYVFTMNVSELKQIAYELTKEYHKAGWYKKRSIRKDLNDVLNEIEYREGRLQYANRPHSFPCARNKSMHRN